MAAAFERRDPAIVGNEYLVVGTLPRRLWRARDDAGMRPVGMLDQTEIFRDVWKFELVGGGWDPAAHRRKVKSVFGGVSPRVPSCVIPVLAATLAPVAVLPEPKAANEHQDSARPTPSIH
jgi:hypothetical protein